MNKKLKIMAVIAIVAVIMIPTTFTEAATWHQYVSEVRTTSSSGYGKMYNRGNARLQVDSEIIRYGRSVSYSYQRSYDYKYPAVSSYYSGSVDYVENGYWYGSWAYVRNSRVGYVSYW